MREILDSIPVYEEKPNQVRCGSAINISQETYDWIRQLARGKNMPAGRFADTLLRNLRSEIEKPKATEAA